MGIDLISSSTRRGVPGWIGSRLTRKIGAGLAAMAIIMLLAIGAIFLQVRQQRSDATVLNVAAEQKLLAQQIAERTARAIEGDARAVAELRQLAERFDLALAELRDGGPEFGLPAAPDSIRPQLESIERIWQPSYQNVAVVEDTNAAGIQVNSLTTALRLRIVGLSAALRGARDSAENPLAYLTAQDGFQTNREMTSIVADLNLDPQGLAPQLATVAERFDLIVRTLVEGDQGLADPTTGTLTTQGLGPAEGALRDNLLDPINGLVFLWNGFHADVQALLPVAETFGAGLSAAREIAASSGPLLQESDVAVDLFEQEARKNVDRTQWFVGGMAGLFLVVFAVVVWVIRRAIRPLGRMTEATAAIANGDFGARVEVSSNDEIGVLASSFNQMTEGLQLRDIELAAINQELEAFNYSVSHDLRAPLRSIDGFSQALLEDYGDQLDNQGKEYLSRARAASQRMGQLIDDLLNLSRVSRVEIRREKLDLSEMARQVASELQLTNPERRVKSVIADGAVAHGDPTLARTVLENLVGNAWKYTEKHEKATIEFGIIQDGRRPTFFVRDDGAGFDMNYASNLFGAFQRLHAVDEFPGTGVGLATVQRIVNRHGGRIWAEGEVEKGATFYFTLG